MTTTQGVIYAAEGEAYFLLAEQSAKSLKTFNPTLTTCLFTDISTQSELFDVVLPIPRHSSRTKVACMRATPFDETLFLDCDTLILDDIRDIFRVLERFDLAIAHDVRRSSNLIEEALDSGIPSVFCQHNSGVLAFNGNAKMKAFLKDWEDLFAENQSTRDQVSLKDLLWHSDIRFWVVPQEWNLRRVTMIDAWEPLDAVPRIVHSHQLLRHIRCAEQQVRKMSEIVDLERTALIEEWANATAAIPEIRDQPRESAFALVRKARDRLSH